MFYRKHLFLSICVLLNALFAPLLLAADKAVVAVVFSVGKTGVPKVYDNIIEGIQAGFDGTVKIYELRSDFSEKKLLAELQTDEVDTVIVLGSKSRKVAALLVSDYPVSVGAVSSIRTKGAGGVIWQPSSKIVIDLLSLLIPDIDELCLIYDPAKHMDMVKRTETAAKSHNLTVTARASSNAKQTQAAIEHIIKDTNIRQSAIWVVFGTRSSTSIKENLLRDSWRQPSLIPFYYTFNPKDIELFPLVFLPDWRGMGEQLAVMAKARLDGENARISPLYNIKLWVNQKKGRHFGLKLDSETRKEIDDIYY